MLTNVLDLGVIKEGKKESFMFENVTFKIFDELTTQLSI